MLRRADASELSFLSGLALRSKAIWGHSADFLARCEAELTLHPGDVDRIYVKEVAGRLVGFYSIVEIDAERAELGHLFVEPSELRKGYGTELVRDACARAREGGRRVLVIQGDPNATQFYEALGCKKVGERESESIADRFLPVFELVIA